LRKFISDRCSTVNVHFFFVSILQYPPYYARFTIPLRCEKTLRQMPMQYGRMLGGFAEAKYFGTANPK
jgi:hypothetical protein